MKILPRRQSPVHHALSLSLWLLPLGPLYIFWYASSGWSDDLLWLRAILPGLALFVYFEFMRPELEGLLHLLRGRGEKNRENFHLRCLNVSTGGEIIKEAVDRFAGLLGTNHIVGVHYDSTGQPVVTGGGSEYEYFLMRPHILPSGPVLNHEQIHDSHGELYNFMEEHAMKSMLQIRHGDLVLALFFLGEELHAARDRQALRTAVDMLPPLAGVFYRHRMTYIQKRNTAIETELREAEYRKDLLLSNVSHEMKTPLTTILGMVEILLYAWMDDESANAEYFKIVTLEARRLKELLEDLQIAAGILPREHPSSLKVKSMVKAKVSDLSHLIEDRGMKVQWRLNLAEDKPGRNARLYLPVIIRHLLTNAIRFNSSGQATILISGVQNEDSQNLQLVIKDNGPGIEFEQLKHVTDPFYRVDSELTYEVPGIGLGLFLVKTLTRKLGGTFRIESDAGRGTEVNLGVPLYSEGDNLRVYDDLERMRRMFSRIGLHLHISDLHNPARATVSDDLLWSGNVEGPAGPAFRASIYGQARPEILDLARQSLELLARMDWREAELEDLTDEIGYNYEELSLLSGLSEKLAMLEDTRGAIDMAVQESGELVHFNRAFLVEFEGEIGTLSWSTSARDRIGREVSEDVNEACARSLGARENAQEEMDRSLLIILPLLPYSHKPAALAFERFNLKNPFSTIDINFLDAIATQLAGKLQNLRYTEEEKYMRRVFQRFAPPRVIDSVLNDKAEPAAANRRRGAILYADFSDFSSLADELGPEEAIELLNEFLGYMTSPLREEQGAVENFYGDGLVALFYQDPGRENLIVRAVRAALKMQTNRLAFNRARGALDRPTFAAGIGIHFGTGLLGEVGTDRSRFSTVIGEAVQVAARLAHRAARTESGILVTEPVFRECQDFFNFQNTEYNIREIPGNLYRAFVPGSNPEGNAPIRLF